MKCCAPGERLMRFPLPLMLFAVVLLLSSSAAQSQSYYWCDSYQTWYPRVTTCPAPWRLILVKPQLPQPGVARAPVGSETVPDTEATRNVPVLGDGLDAWCAQVTLLSS